MIVPIDEAPITNGNRYVGASALRGIVVAAILDLTLHRPTEVGLRWGRAGGLGAGRPGGFRAERCAAALEWARYARRADVTAVLRSLGHLPLRDDVARGSRAMGARDGRARCALPPAEGR